MRRTCGIHYYYKYYIIYILFKSLWWSSCNFNILQGHWPYCCLCTYSAFVIGAQPACLANRFNRLICTKWCHTRPVKCCSPFASFVLQTYCPQHCCRPIVCRRQAIFRAIHRGPIGPAGSTCVRVPSTKIWTLKLVIACVRIQIVFSRALDDKDFSVDWMQAYNCVFRSSLRSLAVVTVADKLLSRPAH